MKTNVYYALKSISLSALLILNFVIISLPANAEPIIAEEEPASAIVMNFCLAALLFLLVLFVVLLIADRFARARQKLDDNN